MNIYFDEAGNSGQNLLDIDQPIYVLVSHNLSSEEADEILHPIQTNAQEIHFKKLRKYPKYQQPIKDVLNHPFINYDRVKIAYYNKKYALCVHLVDQLVETVFHNNNIPYYENGLNIAFAQSLFLQAEVFESKTEYLELLRKFQEMIRSKNLISINNFYSVANKIFQSMKEEGERNFFYPILMSRDYIDDILDSINKFSIDLALPSLTLLSDVWHKRENVQIDIFHDNSKQVDFWRDFILFLSEDITTESINVGFDERKMIFPLQINTIKTLDSKNNPQIQLADLIASSFTHYAKNILLSYNKDDKMANIIAETNLSKIEVHPLQPDLSLMLKDYVGNEDDINPLDFLATKTMDNKDKFDQSYPSA